MTCDATYKDVVMTEEREVSSAGRISGLSRYKGQKVFVVVQKPTECNDPPWREDTQYQASLSGTEAYSPNTNIDVTSDQARVDPDDQDTSATEGV